MKSDGFPTYHFANVVDDHLMRITHVVRGAEWLISTAKHVSLYDAFGWEPPKFAHVGLLVDTNRQKLSKRNMDIGIDSYRRDGILPPALLNFSALLGWSPGALPNKGVMDLDDIVNSFGIKFTKGDIVVNMEKLAFFNKKHIQKALTNPSQGNNDLIDEYLVGPVLRRAREIEAKRQGWLVNNAQRKPEETDLVALLGEPVVGLAPLDGDQGSSVAAERIRNALRISRNEATTAAKVVDANRYLIWQPSSQRLKETSIDLIPESAEILVDGKRSSAVDALRYLIDHVGQIEDTEWFVASVQPALDELTKRIVYCEPEKSPTPAGYKFLRWALLGLDNGPQMSNLMEYLGKSETLMRLKLAQEVIAF
ncbi:Glutamate--tRNA ligase mitochondrial [Sporothrix eucalyptigena]